MSVTLPAGHYLVMVRTSQQAWYGENNSIVADETNSKYWVTGADGVPGTSVIGGKKNQTEQLSVWFPGFSGIKYLIFEQDTTISLFNQTGSTKNYLKGDGIIALKLA